MSLRVFNKKWTRRLESGLKTTDGKPEYIILKPYAFADVPERYTQDITFRMGVQAGDIEVIETRSKQKVLENEPVKETQEKTEKPAKKAGSKKAAAE